MDKINWVAVADRVVQYVAMALLTWWQIKVMRAMSKPAETPAVKARKFPTKIIRFIREYWAAFVAFGIPVVGVVRELTYRPVVSKTSLLFIFVYTIFLSVALSLFGTLLILTYLLKGVRERLTAPPDGEKS